MTTFFLIRHGQNDMVRNAIAGRRPGVHLNAVGHRQAARLAEHLARQPIRHILSSPLERARETAEPLARKLGLNLEISQALNEINFGDWAGKTFSDLEHLEAWKQWNTFRSGSRTPGGESMFEVQARVVGEIERLRRAFPEQTLALFSHGDPLRSAVAYYLGLSLDSLLRLQIDPASVSILVISDWSAQLRALNWCVDGFGE